MRNITKIKTSGLKRDVDLSLDRLTLILGQNGSGKSSVLHAIELAVQGFITGQGKEGSAVMLNSRNGSLQTSIVVDGKAISREWWDKGGSVTQQVVVEGVKANKNGAEGMISLALGKAPVVFSPTALFGLSPKNRTAQIAALFGVDTSAITEDVTKTKERLNELRASYRTKSETCSELSKTMPPVPSRLAEDIETEMASVRALTQDLESRLAAHNDGVLKRKNLTEEIEILKAELAKIPAINVSEKSDLQDQQAEASAKLADVEVEIENDMEMGMCQEHQMKIWEAIEELKKCTCKCAGTLKACTILTDLPITDGSDELSRLKREELLARRLTLQAELEEGNKELARILGDESEAKRLSTKIQTLTKRVQDAPPMLSEQEQEVLATNKAMLEKLTLELGPAKIYAEISRRVELLNLDVTELVEKGQVEKDKLAV